MAQNFTYPCTNSPFDARRQNVHKTSTAGSSSHIAIHKWLAAFQETIEKKPRNNAPCSTLNN